MSETPASHQPPSQPTQGQVGAEVENSLSCNSAFSSSVTSRKYNKMQQVVKEIMAHFTQAEMVNSTLNRDALHALSKEAHRANQQAKTLRGSAQTDLYSEKHRILEIFVMEGAAKVNNLSIDNLVGLDLCDGSRLHAPLVSFSSLARLEILRQTYELEFGTSEEDLR